VHESASPLPPSAQAGTIRALSAGPCAFHDASATLAASPLGHGQHQRGEQPPLIQGVFPEQGSCAGMARSIALSPADGPGERTGAVPPDRHPASGMPGRHSPKEVAFVANESAYEVPTLIEVGDFAELTQLTSEGYWLDSVWGAWWF
jgi:hypothetical protein